MSAIIVHADPINHFQLPTLTGAYRPLEVSRIVLPSPVRRPPGTRSKIDAEMGCSLSGKRACMSAKSCTGSGTRTHLAPFAQVRWPPSRLDRLA